MFVSTKINVYILQLYVNIYCIKLCKIICQLSGLPRLALRYLQSDLNKLKKQNKTKKQKKLIGSHFNE